MITIQLIQQYSDTYKIMLDNRNLKSPDGKIVEIKNRMVALFVAGEWEAQQSVLKAHSLPLVNTIYTLLII